SLTCDAQPFLDRIAVDPAVLEIELVRPVGDLVHGVTRDEPEPDALAPPTELLACPGVGKCCVGCLDGTGVGERLSLSLLPEDFEDHAARTSSRTHFSCSRKRARNARRS